MDHKQTKTKQILLDEKIRFMAEVEYYKYFAQNEKLGSENLKDCERIIEEDTQIIKAIDHAINCVGAIEQIKWERDIAIQQLNELGYQFGEKVKPDEHENVKQLRAECEETLNKDYTKICDAVNKMTPKEWVEEMIYKFGNNYCYCKRLFVCDALFILLDKLAEDKE